MIAFSGKGILLDIEGTTSSISFVYDVMFPFARRELASFLDSNWETSDVRSACDQIAQDANHLSLAKWCGDSALNERKQTVVAEVKRLMDDDVKSTGLKALQGLIWKSGFESGEMQAHIYADVGPAIRQWTSVGCDVRIYSSGSIQAQKLFFGHTIVGNLLEYFTGHYDTTTGSKRESESYRSIADDFGLSPDQILFLSDVAAELDAASDAGMQTGLCIRPGNVEAAVDSNHAKLMSFAEIELP